MVNILLQSIVSGILIGGIYVLTSLGLDTTSAVLDITNFAHGDLAVCAMYLTFWSHTLLKLNVFQLLVFVPLAFAVFSIPLFYGVYQRMIGKPYSAQLIYTTSFSILIQNILLVSFSWNIRDMRLDIRMEAFKVGTLFINKALTLAFCISLVATIIVFYFLYKTERGCIIRATISNRDLISLFGIDASKIYLQSFILAMTVTALGSVLLHTYYSVSPTAGFMYTQFAFIAAVLGGLGSIKGCIIGGLAIGILQIVASTFLPINFMNISVFVLFILVVVFRPRGIFGEERRRGRAGG